MVKARVPRLRQARRAPYGGRPCIFCHAGTDRALPGHRVRRSARGWAPLPGLGERAPPPRRSAVARRGRRRPGSCARAPRRADFPQGARAERPGPPRRVELLEASRCAPPGSASARGSSSRSASAARPATTARGSTSEHPGAAALRSSRAAVSALSAQDPAGHEPVGAEAINQVCLRCHTVLFSHYPYTWEGGLAQRTLPGRQPHPAPGEARDFQLGACAGAMRCTACHDPHGEDRRQDLDRLATPAGNPVCTGCHARYADRGRALAGAHPPRPRRRRQRSATAATCPASTPASPTGGRATTASARPPIR